VQFGRTQGWLSLGFCERLFVRRIVSIRFVGIWREWLGDGVLPFRPADQVHLPAAQAAKWPMRRRRGVGRQRAIADGAARGCSHEDFSLLGLGVDAGLLDVSPVDFDSDLDSDFVSPPDVVFLSASALFLYESLR
jgi:hypothetical protein